MRLERILLTVIFVGVCLAFLMPFFIAPVLYPYSFDKAVFFQVIIEVLLPAWIALILISKKYRPKLDFLNTSFLVFFGVLFVSASFGVDFGKSFWGYESRMTGIFTLLHFLGFYFILRSLFVNKKYKNYIFLSALFISFVVSVISFFEHFYAPFGELMGGDGRSFALFGNSMVFSAYLLPHIFMALYLALVYKNKILRFIFLSLSLFEIFALYFAFTRGAFLGLFAGLFVIFVLWGIFFVFNGRRLKNKKFAVRILFLIVLLIIVSFVFGPLLIEKLSSALKINFSSTASTRLMLWDIAIEGFKDHPILGWGPENFDLVYDAYYNPGFYKYSFYETWSDRAHNLPLEYLANTGILGLGSYLLIFVAAFYTIFKKKEKFKNIILAGGLVAYFTQGLFSFESPASLLVFFFLLAFIPSNNNFRETKVSSFSNVKYIVVLCCVCSVLGIVFFNIRPAIASNYALKSTEILFSNYKIGEDYFKKSLDIWSPYHDAIRLKFANAVYILVNENRLSDVGEKHLLSFAINEIKKSAEKNLMDFSYPLTLGNLYSAADDHEMAFGEYNKAMNLSPKRQIIYLQLASAKFLSGENDAAIDLLKQAVELDKKVGEMHWRLALGLIGINDELAAQEAKKTIFYGFRALKPDEIRALASIFIIKKDWAGLVSFYELLVKSKVETGDIYAQLAAGYLEVGKKEKAREAALRAAELDTSFEGDVKIFLKLIDNK